MLVTKFSSSRAHYQQGFTLIEMIVGIVVFAVALTLVTTLIFPQAGRSVDPIMQVRATELAATLMREITSKPFDERGDGSIRCNDDLNNDGDFEDSGESTCTTAAALGPDPGEFRNETATDYDDVDDYNILSASGGEIRNSLGEPLQLSGQNIYEGFSYSVSVTYDGNFDGIPDNIQSAKLIRIDITTPGGETLEFATYRSNY